MNLPAIAKNDRVALFLVLVIMHNNNHVNGKAFLDTKYRFHQLAFIVVSSDAHTQDLLVVAFFLFRILSTCNRHVGGDIMQ